MTEAHSGHRGSSPIPTPGPEDMKQMVQQASVSVSLNAGSRRRRRHRERKAGGRCSYSSCLADVETGRERCREHLQLAIRYARQRREQRIAAGRCTYCGAHPQFWGRLCINCRESFAKPLLPRGARQALRRYREQERRNEQQQQQQEISIAVRKLLAEIGLRGKAAEALGLYVGLDQGRQRTLREVGELMNLSAERVRQLLLPAKLALSKATGHEASASRLRGNKVLSSAGLAGWLDKNTPRSGRLKDGADWTVSGSNVRDQADKIGAAPALNVPQAAREILAKPAPLTGPELRLLIMAARLTPAELAERLGVVEKTILAWAAAPVLRFTNDLAVRVVLGSLLETNLGFLRNRTSSQLSGRYC